jgi:hypothetical protein
MGGRLIPYTAQVAAVRAAMGADMAQMAAVARQQAAAAADAEARLTARIAWGVRVLQGREDAKACRAVLHHWRSAPPALLCLLHDLLPPLRGPVAA